jgi:hypothetical protein
MKLILNLFLDLCLLRIGPQNIPAAPVLFWYTALLNILINIVILWQDPKRTLIRIIGESVLDVMILLAILHVALRWQKLNARFEQTATAILGSNVLLGCMMVLLPNDRTLGFINEISLLILLCLIIWQFLILGHILRHTFNMLLSQGIIIGVIYTLLSYTILGIVFLTT